MKGKIYELSDYVRTDARRKAGERRNKNR